jgi:hypothetical protein
LTLFAYVGTVFGSLSSAAQVAFGLDSALRRNMHRRCRATAGTLVLVLAAMELVAGRAAEAQSAPPSIPGPVIRSTVPLTSDQTANVKANVDYYVGLMANPQSTADQVEHARDQLAKNVAAISSPSDTFRFQYSQIAVPLLEEVIRGQNPNLHPAVNALIVGPRACPLRSVQ